MKTKLTARQQRTAARAWRYAQPVIRRFHDWLKGPEYDGFVAERLVVQSPHYRKSERVSLGAWSCGHARYACLDAMRSNVMLGPRYCVATPPKGDRVRVCQLDPSGEETLAVEDSPAPWEVADNLADIARGLTAREIRLIVMVYRDGLSVAQAAAEMGLSEIHVRRAVYRKAIARLRVVYGVTAPSDKLPYLTRSVA